MSSFDNISYDLSIHPLNVLSDKIKMLTADELGYPNQEIIELARSFLAKFPLVDCRFKQARFDYDGGIILDFTENLVIGISFHKAFFPSQNSQPIERYYFESELDLLVNKFF